MASTDNPPIAVIPLRGMRGMIADAMRHSLDEAAQLTHFAECDATALLAAKEKWAKAGTRLSLEDLILFVTAATLLRHPACNGRLESGEIRQSATVDLGVAIALPEDRLVAPALFDAARLSLPELAAARRGLVERAREGKLTLREMTGGSFTVSNLGATRVRFFTPILNLPQIALLGVGEIAPRPWVTPQGDLAVRPVMGLSLTFDHRAVNGAPAAAFLSDLCIALEGCDAGG